MYYYKIVKTNSQITTIDYFTVLMYYTKRKLKIEN